MLSYVQSSAPVELKEETGYAVNVVKHIFGRHVVFQYNCNNKIPEQLLENVKAVESAGICSVLLSHCSFPFSSYSYSYPVFHYLLGDCNCGLF